MTENKVTTATTQVDLTCVKPYGDALNDGKVQLSFTLPVPYGEEAEERMLLLRTDEGIYFL